MNECKHFTRLQVYKSFVLAFTQRPARFKIPCMAVCIILGKYFASCHSKAKRFLAYISMFMCFQLFFFIFVSETYSDIIYVSSWGILYMKVKPINRIFKQKLSDIKLDLNEKILFTHLAQSNIVWYKNILKICITNDSENVFLTIILRIVERFFLYSSTL